MVEEYPVSTATEDRILYVPTLNRPQIINLELKNGDQREIYPIDLNDRTIHGPKILSCRQDHNAELIVFSVDRYHNQVDLTETCCIIQFKTINPSTGEPFLGLYPVQYYDIYSKADENLILIPWEIPIAVTQAAIEIEYNIRFYKLVPLDQDDTSIYYPSLIFNLNTQSTTAKIVNTLSVSDDRLNGQYANVVEMFKANLDDYNYTVLLDRVKNAFDDTILRWANANDLLNS